MHADSRLGPFYAVGADAPHQRPPRGQVTTIVATFLEPERNGLKWAGVE
jgi:hypothetical protein